MPEGERGASAALGTTREQGRVPLPPPSLPPHLCAFWKLQLNLALDVIWYQNSPESEQEMLTDKTGTF